MFVISPVQDKEAQRALCARLGAEFHLCDFAYRVTIDEKEAGTVTFFIKGKNAFLRQIVFYPDMQDFEVMFIAGRCAMEFMDRVGAHNSYFLSPDKENERLTVALGYKKQPDGSFFFDTTGFFEDHCGNSAGKADRGQTDQTEST